MQKNIVLSFVALLSFLSVALLGGCGSGNKEGIDFPIAGPTKVGSESCVNTCHAATVDVTGDVIATSWGSPLNTHTQDGNVQCEDCHGGASQHHGVGPIPFPTPQAAQCITCHSDFTGFNGTAHANAHLPKGPFGPDKYFFQGNAGTSQATSQERGSDTVVPEFTPSGVPVSKAQHIEECSVCHNSSQRFVYNSSGVLTNPDPGNMPNPQVSCASCHDAHFTQSKQVIPQRVAAVGYPNFRNYIVDPLTGAQVDPGTPDSQSIHGFIFQPNGAAMGGTVFLRNNEVTPELVCSPCHTVGLYKYWKKPTHQLDTYSQWKNSGHALRDAAAFAEFSANPPAYTDPFTGQPYPVGTHQTTYPIDMALKQFGATASLTQNAGSNNFACFKCHNGLTSLAWQDNVQGTKAAPVVFGDATVTCVTCHDPHTNVPGQGANTRKPVVMTNYSTSSVKIVGNVFLDTTPVPSATENATICVYCHQGRESGYTLYKTKLAPGKSSAGNFFNPHYLGTGAMLWGVNAYEFSGKFYSVNAAHQDANCTTCHMNNPSENALLGGHTWKPHVVSCNTSTCHSSVTPPVGSIPGTLSPDVAAYRASFDTNDYDGDGVLEPIAVEIQHLQTNVIALLAANGIYYNDLIYPYFFANPTFTIPFTTWNTAVGGNDAYKAAFNVQYIVKGLPSAGTSQTLVPNSSAAVHDYKYCIQVLRDSYDQYNAVAPVKGPVLGGVRPVGTRPATVYGPGQ